MKDYLKHYVIIVETLAPLFIGCGEKLGKKEYVYNRNEKQAYIMDVSRMYAEILKKRLGPSYETYLLKENKDLLIWMRENQVSKSEYKNWTKYQLDCSDAEIYGKNKEISLFTKDPYGNPYIPGSSLKGALRTILLGADLKKSFTGRGTTEQIKNNSRIRTSRKKYLAREVKELESEVFHTLNWKKSKKQDAVNDELSGLRISDSEPLTTKDLILCQKIDRNISGTERKMPLLRECLKPKTKVKFQLTIDETICDYTVDRILNAIDEVFQSNLAFYEKFGKIDKSSEHTFYFGGGSGFVSKTIEYSLYPEREAVQVVSNIFRNTTPRNHGHAQDMKLRVSPHIQKVTHYSGKRYEFGFCSIKIEKA
jgi:CRISPR-associated protein Csm5